MTASARHRLHGQLRRVAFGAMLLVLAQAALGMAVNLDVTVPRSHPGARASNFLSGSFASVVWAIGHGGVALAAHAALGLGLVVITIAITIDAFKLRRRSISAWSALAVLVVIGAGFNGASFLDYNHDVNSLIMALLAFSAVACYAVVLFLLADIPPGSRP